MYLLGSSWVPVEHRTQLLCPQPCPWPGMGRAVEGHALGFSWLGPWPCALEEAEMDFPSGEDRTPKKGGCLGLKCPGRFVFKELGPEGIGEG